MKILDLGCGKNKIKPFGENDVVIGLDSIKLKGVDVVWDLEKTPLPFKTNEFSYIYCSQVLEHVHNFIPLVEELHRITKKGGLVHVEVPSYKSSMAFTDPTHKRFFTFKTFDYFTEEANLNYYSKDRFEIESRKKRYSGRKLDNATGWIKNVFLNSLAKAVIMTLVGKRNEYSLIFDLKVVK